MADLKDLAAHITKIKTVVVGESERLKREVATEILRTVVVNTPADTSLHLSNWLVGVGFAPSGVIEAHVPGIEGKTKGISAAITIAIGVGELANSLKAKPIFISNAAPVIVDLNSGSIVSDQPGGFVEKGIAAGENVVRRFKFKGL